MADLQPVPEPSLALRIVMMPIVFAAIALMALAIRINGRFQP
jgi:hypothetical protein